MEFIYIEMVINIYNFCFNGIPITRYNIYFTELL